MHRLIVLFIFTIFTWLGTSVYRGEFHTATTVVDSYSLSMTSHAPIPPPPIAAKPIRASGSSPVCEALQKYPKAPGEKLSFEAGDVSPICKPFVRFNRRELDRCGDTAKDPYASTISSTTSKFTWASRNEMSRKGKVNLFADAQWQPLLPDIMKRTSELKERSAQLCCGADDSCKAEFEKVDISLCQPSADPNSPDPCVFGGSFKMPGSGYDSIFRAIHRAYGSKDAELKRLAERNLRFVNSEQMVANAGPAPGHIVLTSYVSKQAGPAALEPVALHEFGHACSMVKMQSQALSGDQKKALRATQWLDSARNRCNPNYEIPEAYFDFWESIGESRALATCFVNLTQANQKQQIDRACSNLCPGHYLEESVGIAFSMLAGDVSGLASSVYPNTCDHVRDGQHPLVSDVAECLAQHSPRFREKLKITYGCS